MWVGGVEVMSVCFTSRCLLLLVGAGVVGHERKALRFEVIMKHLL